MLTLAGHFPSSDAAQKTRLKVHLFSQALWSTLRDDLPRPPHDVVVTAGSLRLLRTESPSSGTPSLGTPTTNNTSPPTHEDVDMKLRNLLQTDLPITSSSLQHTYSTLTGILATLDDSPSHTNTTHKQPQKSTTRNPHPTPTNAPQKLLRKMHFRLGLSRMQIRQNTPPSYLTRLSQIQQNKARQARLLYWRDRKKLHRLLDTGQLHRQKFEAAYDALLAHHRSEAAAVTRDTCSIPWEKLRSMSDPFDPSNETDVALTQSFTIAEVEHALSHLQPNTTAARDRVQARIVKLLSKHQTSDPPRPLTLLLQAIFNESLATGHHVIDWQTGAAALILKNDSDPENIRSWRHIVITSVLYRAYTSILSNRLTAFIARGNRVSKMQHGFRPNLGTHPHVSTLLSLMDHAALTTTDFFALFIDFRNAFGSIPFDLIYRSLNALHCPDHFAVVLRDLYSGISMYFKDLVEEPSPADLIPIERGVRQGCPLSPIIFLIAINPLLLWIESDQDAMGYSLQEQEVRHLSYADDACFLPRDVPSLTRMVTILNSFCEEAKLTVNTEKCGLIAAPRGTSTKFFALYLGDTQVPVIHPQGDKPFYRYLGYPIAFHTDWSTIQSDCATELSRRLSKIKKSGLLPLQMISTATCWAVPVISYMMPLAHFSVPWLESVDKTIIQFTRDCIPSSSGSPLPRSIPSIFLNAPPRSGGLGVPRASHLFQNARIKIIPLLLGYTNGSIHPSLRVCRTATLHLLTRAAPSLHSRSRESSLPFARGLTWALSCLRLCMPGLTIGNPSVAPALIHALPIPALRGLHPTNRHVTNLIKTFTQEQPVDSATLFLARYNKINKRPGNANMTDTPKPIGIAASIQWLGTCYYCAAITDQMSSSLSTWLTLELALDLLPPGDPPPLTTVFLPSLYTLRCLLGLIPIQQDHNRVARIQNLLATRGAITLCLLPDSIRAEGVRSARYHARLAHRLQSSSYGSYPRRSTGPLTPSAQVTPPQPLFLSPSLDLRELRTNALQCKWSLMKPKRSQMLDPLETKLSYRLGRDHSLPSSKLRDLTLLRFGTALYNPPPCPWGCSYPMSQSHLLGGCARFKPLHTARHDRVVRKIANWLQLQAPDSELSYNTSTISYNTSTRTSTSDKCSLLPPEIFGVSPAQSPVLPDIFSIDFAKRLVTVVEIGISNSKNLDLAWSSKHNQYTSLQKSIIDGGSYNCHKATLVFGAVGEIPRRAVDQLSLAFPLIALPLIMKLFQAVSSSIAADAVHLLQSLRAKSN